jgi:glycolate oxidase FAD binding subunit
MAAFGSMPHTLSPTTPDAVLAAVQEALAAETPLEIVGHGTKRGWGRPVDGDRVLDLSGLSGITLYEPEELVLAAKAGTPMAEIEALLAANRQMLAFEPPFLFPPPLGGEGAGERGDTLGGVVACNLSGPRRIKSGAARDHVLGVRAVNGRGEAFKAGGRVMKNVTGYDLPKLLCGSFGTLAVMTELTVKVMPAPERSRTVLVLGLTDEQARDAMAAALNSPHDVSGAAHLPEAAAARSGVGYVRGAGRAVTAIRVEGFGPSVEARCHALRGLLTRYGAVEELHGRNTAALWRELRDVAALLPDPARDWWRLSVPPASGAGVVAALARAGDADAAHAVYDWGGGLIWLAVPPTRPAETAAIRAAAIRAAALSAGGHATLIRAPAATRAAVPVFQPEPAAIAAVARKLKENFDPKAILNPGRMADRE